MPKLIFTAGRVYFQCLLFCFNLGLVNHYVSVSLYTFINIMYSYYIRLTIIMKFVPISERCTYKNIICSRGRERERGLKEEEDDLGFHKFN